MTFRYQHPFESSVRLRSARLILPAGKAGPVVESRVFTGTPASGGFISNIFHGAAVALKGYFS